MFAPEAIETISAMARAEGFEPAAVLAVAEIESGGHAHAVIDGRTEPLIRFEGHYFDRRLSGERRAEARRTGLADPRAGAVLNPRSQAERWALLRRAAAIDRRAAYESVSWGVGQVMGVHWSRLGFADVDGLVAEARSGLAGQVRLMLAYVRQAGLQKALARHDWQAFARGYNGPGFAASQYDRKLARAYRRYAAADDGQAHGRLAEGARGPAVSDLQILLSALGYPVAADGVFGRLTREALARFQQDQGLKADGVVDTATWAALRKAMPLGSFLSKAGRWLLGLLRRGA
ncbi:N-acetylmuramidase domain-containing protein [Nitratireductor sp. ZSWI3]|nr:N-acetylmuramidase domain-containing protein [Nitratireductor sp. ZSWI3]